MAAKRRAAEADAAGPLPERSDVATDNPLPTPPFWGTRVVRGVALAEYAGLVDERALFLGQWGLRGARGGSGPSYEELVETEGRPRLRYWLDRLSTEGVLAHAAVVYGYFPAVSEQRLAAGADRADGPDAPARDRAGVPAPAPRPAPVPGRLLAAPRGSRPSAGEVDVLPLHLVTMGQPIADYAAELFAKDAYRDYLEVHGLGVQLTEALAEYWHRRIREELTVPGRRRRWPPRTRPTSRSTSSSATGAPATRSATAPAPTSTTATKIVELLQPERIGVELSEELQLHPEQSTDAMVAHHPEAKYFNAG